MSLIPWKQKREEAEETNQVLPTLRREADSLFDRFFEEPWSMTPWRSSRFATGGFPRTDLAESENQVIVKMDLPGVDPKDVEIDITSGVLTVRGEKKHEKEEKGKDFHYVEREHGSFHRSVQLPSSVNPDKVSAGHKNGVLTISIDKHPQAKPRRILVRSE